MAAGMDGADSGDGHTCGARARLRSMGLAIGGRVGEAVPSGARPVGTGLGERLGRGLVSGEEVDGGWGWTRAAQGRALEGRRSALRRRPGRPGNAIGLEEPG